MEVVGPAIGVLLAGNTEGMTVRNNKRGLVLCSMDSGCSSMDQPAGVAGAWLLAAGVNGCYKIVWWFIHWCWLA